jgi:hypothetical protein
MYPPFRMDAFYCRGMTVGMHPAEPTSRPLPARGLREGGDPAISCSAQQTAPRRSGPGKSYSSPITQKPLNTSAPSAIVQARLTSTRPWTSSQGRGQRLRQAAGQVVPRRPGSRHFR